MFLGMDWSTVWLKFGRQKSRSQTTGSSFKESDNHIVSKYLWLRNELVKNAISAFGDRVMAFEELCSGLCATWHLPIRVLWFQRAEHTFTPLLHRSQASHAR